MTATGALIARHVTDLFPTQTSRFDLAQAARRGVIAPLRCVRIPPGPGVRTIAKVPLRRGEVDTEFDQEMLAELLDQLPFNLAIADLYKTRFNGVPGVVYSAGVRHAYNVAEAFRELGMKAQAVSGETPKRELAEILARYERGDVDVLVNAQLLAEGWNSPRATVCMHLAPTASKRIYQQRVGRVTRRQPGKEAGIVVDFVHPATKHDDPVVTLHSLLDRDVYRGGAIVVGPVRRGRGRRLRVERRVLPVTADENRRIEVFERELWRIAVEHLDYGEQVQWAALAGARVAPAGWRRARAMLHFDQGGELKRTFLLTAVERNKNPQLRLRALQEIAASKDAEAFDRALDFVEGWPRDDKREGVKVVLQALAEKKIGRRDQANNWIWRCANLTREVHEEYAVQRWPETKRLLGLLVNSSGGAHARNARRLVHAARQQDRRLSRRAARRRAAAHRRGRRGHQRRPHADVAQAGRARPRAAAQLPEGQGQALLARAAARRAPGRARSTRSRRPRPPRRRWPARGRRRPEGGAARARGQAEAPPRPLPHRAGPSTPIPATPRPRAGARGRAGGRGRGEAQAQARPAQEARGGRGRGPARGGGPPPRRSPSARRARGRASPPRRRPRAARRREPEEAPAKPKRSRARKPAAAEEPPKPKRAPARAQASPGREGRRGRRRARGRRAAREAEARHPRAQEARRRAEPARGRDGARPRRRRGRRGRRSGLDASSAGQHAAGRCRRPRPRTALDRVDAAGSNCVPEQARSSASASAAVAGDFTHAIDRRLFVDPRKMG